MTIDRLVVDDLDARESARPGASDTVDDARRADEIVRAQDVRDQALGRLTAALGRSLVGLPPKPTFSLTTREAGLIEHGGTSSTGSIPFEYIFSSFGALDGHPVLDARLELGVTRHGELSRIAISALDVREVASAPIVRTPEEALHALGSTIEASNPDMLHYEITAARVGFAFPSGAPPTALGSLELFADYVVVYPGNSVTPAVSRRYPVSLSLISSSDPVARDEPEAPADDDLGDSRHEALAR